MHLQRTSRVIRQILLWLRFCVNILIIEIVPRKIGDDPKVELVRYLEVKLKLIESSAKDF